MTVCNMSIEAGARAGMVAPDDATFAYLKGAATQPAEPNGSGASTIGVRLATDEGAHWDKEVTIDAASLVPHVTWGTNPGQVVRLDASVPSPDSFSSPAAREAAPSGTVVHGPHRRHTHEAGEDRHGFHRFLH